MMHHHQKNPEKKGHYVYSQGTYIKVQHPNKVNVSFRAEIKVKQ